MSTFSNVGLALGIFITIGGYYLILSAGDGERDRIILGFRVGLIGLALFFSGGLMAILEPTVVPETIGEETQQQQDAR